MLHANLCWKVLTFAAFGLNTLSKLEYGRTDCLILKPTTD